MSQPSNPCSPILVVDDEPHVLHGFEMALRLAGMNNILLCSDSREVMGILARQEIEVVLLDLTMPFVSGEELLARIPPEYPDLPVIVITGANDVRTAVGCMKAGAFDYMVKPVEDRRLSSGVQRAIELRDLRRENRRIRQSWFEGKLNHPEAFREIVTQNATMRVLFQYCETIASSPKPVLITGETGVGKELLARAIHVLSNRSGAFVPVNAAGLDDTMFSDTLFGHVRGAYTGADDARAGLVERAAGGTLFLDEIGDLNLNCQMKLLRLLQEREYSPLGADLPKQTDARVIVATNKEIDALQRAGQFRKDLYYRLQTHHVHIPPLRERMDDLALLIDHFAAKAATTLDKKAPNWPKELQTLLRSYDFPGNLREFESLMFDAVSRHESGVLSLDVFRAHIGNRERTIAGPKPSDPEESGNPFRTWPTLPSLKEAAQWLVEEAMRRADGNQGAAALHLGISRTSLNKRLSRKAQKME